MADTSRMETIYRVEFERQIEWIIRYAILTLAALLYYLDFGDQLALAWLAAYIAVHTSLRLFVLKYRKTSTRWMHDLAMVWSYVLLVTLLSYPVQQVLVGGPSAAFGGAVILGCTFFHALARTERDFTTITVWSLAFLTAIGALVYGLLPRVDTPFAVAGILFAAIVLACYFFMALMTSRRLRIEMYQNAERASQEQKLSAIGRLAGGVAHDFNNALTGISGNLELYFEIDDPVEREQLLRNAQEASARAAHLVQQLLVYSRKSGVHRECANARDLIQEVAAFKRRLLPANVTLEVTADDALRANVDKHLMVTALINLAVNAVDAMPNGGRITLAARRDHLIKPLETVDSRLLPVGPYARFSVEDTGTGIPPDILPRVIEPFFSTKPVGKGSGLGLSMVTGLAQSLAGGVEIETGTRGTTVSILIPEVDSQRPKRPRVMGLHAAE